MNDKKDYKKRMAQIFAGNNFRIFPLGVNSKKPAIKSWPEKATSNIKDIENWWTQNPNFNVGLATGNKIVVIDLDVKNGKNGVNSLKNWELNNMRLPPTREARTVSGGKHMYYKINKPYRNRTDLLDGVDIRGDGGYVVAPGSEIDGTAYEWINNLPIADADEAVYKFLETSTSKCLNNQSSINLKSQQLPEVIPEGKRDDTIFRYACSLQAKGFEDEEISNMVYTANEERCKPPLTENIVEQKILQALKYEKGKKFIKTNVDFEDVDEVDDFNEEAISELTREELISVKLFTYLISIVDVFRKEQVETKCLNRARELKIANDFKRNYRAYQTNLALQGKMTKLNSTHFDGQPFSLICGEWIADDAGVRLLKTNNNGNIAFDIASTIPIMPTAILENTDSGIEKVKIEFYKNGWKSIICDRSTTASSCKIIEIANAGVEVNTENSKMLVKYLADCVSMNLDSLPKFKALGRLGWVNDKFMPYDSDLLFDGEKENKFLYEAVESAGTLDAWVEFMKPLRQNLYLRLLMAASFASPLIEKVNALPFVFHLWGGTGSGKTVGLMAAMSIWGNPKMGKMVRTMNMTANSMMSTAAFLCNFPFAGDELQTIKNRWEGYDNLIMKVTEGIDRGRMSYDKLNELKSWKCSFLFTGEEPCTKASSGGGTKNRVIEIECADKVVDNGNQIVNFINKNFGYAGIEFINGIKQEKNLAEHYSNIFNDIMTKCNTTEKQAIAMALMLLGDRLAVKYIFKDEKVLQLSDVSKFLSSAEEVDIAERAYDHVINLAARHSSRFTETNAGEHWGKINGNYILFSKNALEKEMALEGFDFDAVKNKWFQKGYLVKSKTNRFFHQTQVFGIRASYVMLKQKMDD